MSRKIPCSNSGTSGCTNFVESKGNILCSSCLEKRKTLMKHKRDDQIDELLEKNGTMGKDLEMLRKQNHSLLENIKDLEKQLELAWLEKKTTTLTDYENKIEEYKILIQKLDESHKEEMDKRDMLNYKKLFDTALQLENEQKNSVNLIRENEKQKQVIEKLTSENEKQKQAIEKLTAETQNKELSGIEQSTYYTDLVNRYVKENEELIAYKISVESNYDNLVCENLFLKIENARLKKIGEHV